MKKIKYLIIVFVIFFSASCKKYLDINQNPNNPTDVEPALVVSQALNASANNLFFNFSGGLNQWIGSTSRSAGFAPNTAFESFQITQGQFQGAWTGAYKVIYDLNFIERKSQASGQTFFEGLAKILKAYWYQSLVDMFNNIPYTEAANPTEIKTPKYDDAKTIYEDLIKKIDAAITLIKSSGSLAPADTKFDIMYQGSKTSWIKFANTLKLRILMRQAEMAGRTAYIQAEIAKIVTEGTGFMVEGEDAFINPGYENTAGKQSPIYSAYLTPTGTPAGGNFTRAHQFALDLLKNTNDPRLDFIYQKPANGIHLGNVLGLALNANAITSTPGPAIYKNPNSPFPFMLAFESLFFQSEAAFRGWLPGANAKALYERAITNSFTYLGVPNAATAATSYFTQGLTNVDWNLSSNKLQAIAMQKYVALTILNAFEGWTELRRMGFPVISPASQSPVVTTNQIPVRALYPQVEYDVNSENVLAQGTISQFTSKIFWMK